MGEDRLARAARAEWGPLSRAVRAGSAARGWRGAAMTLFAVCLTAFFHFAQNRTWGGFVRVLGEVRAEDPLWLSLLRTPLSVCVPAADLPVWGALAQLLLVGAVAELSMGRWRTLLIAYASTLVGTLYARAGIALGPGAPLGLPASDALVVDTGPSAAVVGLAVFVCLRWRARFTALAVTAAIVAEVVVKDNLAGREHLAALAVTVAAWALQRGAESPWRPSANGAA
ncbi:hypothetical protein [Streptomyces tsukubensis]|uniref:Uncharacterized protein n=1 Tax=Streptomyces tsukubensis TaxID=83656 RepID=A0A1V4A6Q4_9ACTN|nr:hypothetical protein [Streptomyces tsukubensis]OON77697.1 hypothetical protein B1H18_18435 [Streptomyces tsukubensis]